jgi:hypothetical protein
MFQVGDVVIVSRAVSFSGAPSSLQGVKGRLAWLSPGGRAGTVIPDGELDEVWVFTRELDPCKVES